MTILIRASNGATVQFPDGTSTETINGVMAKHFGEGTLAAEPTGKPPFDSTQPFEAPPAAPMPTFEMRGPDGGTYHVNAPDEKAAIAAFSKFHGIKSPSAVPPGFVLDKPPFDPSKPYSAAPIGDGRASMVAALRGVPVLGAYADKGAAMLNAAAQPLTETGLSHAGSYSEREAENEGLIKGATDKFEKDNPIGTGVGKFAVGSAALAPALAAAPELLGAAGTLGARTVMGGLSNAIIGGADSAARGENPITGALVGGTIGAAGPLAGVAARVAKGATWDPIASNISARINPERFAQRQVARGIYESGLTPNELSTRVIQAGNEGQDVYTLADAMGNPGQRMLSTVARAPGEGRTAVVNALEARQAGQGRRISNALAEGFDSPTTAAQTEARLTAARGTAADADFGQVRNDANPVDVVGTINHIDQTIGTGPGQQLAQPYDSIETTLRGFRERLARVNPDDFAAVQRIRGEMADTAQNAQQNGYGNRARLIGGAVRQLDAAMEAASPGHAAANRRFAQASRNIDAVDQGRTAATRGRTEDTIPAFQALPAEGQAAFRSGYVDPLIEKAQGAAFGANKAQPLINDAFQAEAGAMAPGNPLMQRQIGREQTMFETRQQALGGSRTADNLADASAMAVDPHLVGAIGHVLSGNIGGAVRSVGSLLANGWTGNTPQVRQQVAQILLQRAPNMRPAALEQMVTQVMARMQRVQATARSLMRGATGALVPQVNQK